MKKRQLTPMAIAYQAACRNGRRGEPPHVARKPKLLARDHKSVVTFEC